MVWQKRADKEGEKDHGGKNPNQLCECLTMKSKPRTLVLTVMRNKQYNKYSAKRAHKFYIQTTINRN